MSTQPRRLMLIAVEPREGEEEHILRMLAGTALASVMDHPHRPNSRSLRAYSPVILEGEDVSIAEALLIGAGAKIWPEDWPGELPPMVVDYEPGE